MPLFFEPEALYDGTVLNYDAFYEALNIADYGIVRVVPPPIAAAFVRQTERCCSVRWSRQKLLTALDDRSF